MEEKIWREIDSDLFDHRKKFRDISSFAGIKGGVGSQVNRILSKEQSSFK
jgi:hypothetical protein